MIQDVDEGQMGVCKGGIETHNRLCTNTKVKKRTKQRQHTNPPNKQDVADREPFKSTTAAAARQALVRDLHLLKTDLFMELVETGRMPLRPGVAELVREAVAAGVPVAVCSTSNERAVSTIVRVMLGEDVAKVMRVFAGDVVPRKKPDPAIYLLAAKELGVDPSR